MRIPFTQVDAFADEAFKGNPTAMLSSVSSSSH